jgi:hypothetical protein
MKWSIVTSPTFLQKPLKTIGISGKIDMSSERGSANALSSTSAGHTTPGRTHKRVGRGDARKLCRDSLHPPKLQDLGRLWLNWRVLLSSHTSRLGEASVGRLPWCDGLRRRTLNSGPMTANGFESRSQIWDRAREHRELNRCETSEHDAKACVAHLRPQGRCSVRGSADGVHGTAVRPVATVGKAVVKPSRRRCTGIRPPICGAEKAPSSRSDRGPQGPRERVGRDSLPSS